MSRRVSMSFMLSIVMCLALVQITNVDASASPGRRMYAQEKPKLWDILTGKHGVETALQGLRDNQVLDMKREISGFVTGVVVLGVMLAVTWCVSIFACLRLLAHRSALRTLKAAREESKVQHTTGAPLMPYTAPLMTPSATMVGNIPIAPAAASHVVQHPHAHRHSPSHGHDHGHSHGYRYGHGHN